MKRVITNCLKISPLTMGTYAYCAVKNSKLDKYATGLRNFKGFKNR